MQMANLSSCTVASRHVSSHFPNDTPTFQRGESYAAERSQNRRQGELHLEIWGLPVIGLWRF